MLGQIHEIIDENGVVTLKGHLSTYAINLEFKLVPIENRQDKKSPEYNIVGRGKHGKAFHAGVSWSGEHVQYGRYFSMKIEVPELFDGELSLMAGEEGNSGVFSVRHSKDQEKGAA